jgi:hypothetical protein
MNYLTHTYAICTRNPLSDTTVAHDATWARHIKDWWKWASQIQSNCSPYEKELARGPDTLVTIFDRYKISLLVVC